MYNSTFYSQHKSIKTSCKTCEPFEILGAISDIFIHHAKFSVFFKMANNMIFKIGNFGIILE
jgi:hypothetical protein